MKKRIGFLLLLSGIWADITLAASSSALLHQYLSRIHTFEAQYQQSILSSEGKVKQKISGKFLLKKPNCFVWEVIQPTQQKIISNGREIWLYQPKLKQAIRKPIQPSFQKSPIEFLSGSAREFSHYFHIQMIKKDQETIFRLIPKNKKIALQAMQLVFQKKQLHQLLFEDALGQKVRIYFEKIRENIALPPTLFEFVPPKGIDIIR